jgi:hypothetical protein
VFVDVGRVGVHSVQATVDAPRVVARHLQERAWSPRRGRLKARPRIVVAGGGLTRHLKERRTSHHQRGYWFEDSEHASHHRFRRRSEKQVSLKLEDTAPIPIQVGYRDPRLP